MKRLVLVVLAAIAIVACLAGCSGTKTVSGSCTTVVKECQEFKTADRPTVEVTGRPWLGSESMGKMVYISDSGNAGDPYVAVYFKDEHHKPVVGRVTVKGTLDSKMTRDNSISIIDAEVVG